MKHAAARVKRFGRVQGVLAVAAVCAAMHGCVFAPAAAPPCHEEFGPGAAGEDLARLHGVIDRAVEQYGKVREYRCAFEKRQRIGGRLQDAQRMLLKFRKPMDVYMKWLSKQHEGQEMLYSPSRYGPRALVRAGGWKGMVSPVIHIDVDGYWVMRDNIHPINHTGVGYFLELFMQNARRAREEKASAVIDRGTETVSRRRTRVLESLLPADRSKGYYCYRCMVWFDEENGLPVKIQIYDWDDNLSEEYLYENLELNPGFTDKDFDRHNPKYHF
jgi:hypothetical protein